jgi:hypothetical protein
MSVGINIIERAVNTADDPSNNGNGYATRFVACCAASCLDPRIGERVLSRSATRPGYSTHRNQTRERTMTTNLQTDETIPYAYAFARSEHDITEIKVVLRRLIRNHSEREFGSLVVRCYVSSNMECGPYGVKLCAEGNEHMELDEMVAATKVMTSIHKKLAKMEVQFGYVSDSDFPEFARRVLVASGIRHVLYERTFSQGATDRNGLSLKDGIFGLPQVDPHKGGDFLSSIRDLVNDTLQKRGPVAA